MTATHRRADSGCIVRSDLAMLGSGRTIMSVLSTGDVARDNHTVAVDGWEHADSVPLLDSHDDRSLANVLGKVSDIHVGTATLKDGRTVKALLGTLTFADGDTNPAAEVAYQLYRQRFADSVSVSWLPIEWDYAQDCGPGALDFTRQELLEVSACAIPADPNATVIARAIMSRYGRTDSNTFAARGHLTRAQTHHRTVTGHHERTSEHLRDLRETIDRTASTLASLGIHDHEATRAVSALERCHRDLRSSHDAASDAHNLTGDALAAVASCLAGTGTGPTTGTDLQAGTSGERARADRVRRARELVAKGEADEQADRARRAFELVAKGCP
jgi:hypothetical protein